MRLHILAAATLILACGTNDNANQNTDGGSGGGGSTVHALSVAVSGNGRITSSPTGIDCGTACSAQFAAGSVVALVAHPDAGWALQNWSGACSGTQACSVTMNADSVVTATFTQLPPQRFLVSVALQGAGSGRVTSTPAGIDCPGTCTMTAVAGTAVSLAAAPAAGSGFAGWGGACSGTLACSLTVTADSAVTATFTQLPPQNFQVAVVVQGTGSGRVTSTPPGIDCPGTCAMTATSGTAISLAAVPAAGSRFIGWGGGCSGPGICALTVTADVTVWADFGINDCAGLAPGALPAAVSFQTTYSIASVPDFCGLPIGNGNGSVALRTLPSGHPRWTVLSPSGVLLGTFGFWRGDVWPTRWNAALLPGGFIGYSGSSTQQMTVVTSFFDSGTTYGVAPVNGSAIFAPDPNGGLFAVGHFNTGSGPSMPPPDDKAEMFGSGAEVRWGPVSLGTDATVFGAGVDLLGRAVVILDGGAGSIAAIWFDQHGAALTGIFEIISGFEAGPSTWFETSPLIGGGLALRRVDAPSDSLHEERRTSQWLLVLPSGTSSTLPAPDWLTQRPDTTMQLARSGAAYALLPWAADVNHCVQQVEIVSPSGNSCGKLDFPVDDGACRTRELRLGLDGTVMQMLPASREQNQPPGSTVYTCTLRYWPAAAR